MGSRPRFGSIFAGIGGFDLGLERAGWSPAWQVEIDPKCQDVARYHWPTVERHADVCTAGAATLAPVDLLCGGFPCQDISVAGRRAGLAGERSGLWWEFHRIARELRPSWLVIENVGGLLSSNGGRDLGAILGALGELGYGWAYRCFDSRYFGLAQRRYRVFIVGHRGGRGAAAVLLEPEGVPRDLAARREAREDTARPLAGGSASSGGYRNDADTADSLIPALAATLTHGVDSNGRGGYAWRRREDDENLIAGTVCSGRRVPGVDDAARGMLVAGPVLARNGKGLDSDGVGVIAHTLRASGHDASGDGTGRGAPLVAVDLQNGGVGELCGTIQSAGQATGNRGYGVLADTLRSHPRPGSNSVGALAFNWQSGGDCRINASESATDALSVGQVPAIGFAVNQRREGRLQDVAGSVHEPSGTQLDDAVTPMGVRRLTPRECERLQGFPDDWTLHGRREDGTVYRLADAPRYRALGNAVSVPVAEWIGARTRAAAIGRESAA